MSLKNVRLEAEQRRLVVKVSVFAAPTILVALWFWGMTSFDVDRDGRLWAVGGAVTTAVLVYLFMDGDRKWQALCGGVYTAVLGLCAVALWLEAVVPARELGVVRFAQVVGGLSVADAFLVLGPGVALLPLSWVWVEWFGKAAGWTGREKRKLAESELFGKARLLGRQHIRELEARQGILLGQSGGRANSPLVGWGLEGSAMTFAPPRTGKGATIALNYLAPRGRGWPGSTVLLDPRGETWCIVARRRRAMGRETVLLDPFGVVRRYKENFVEREGDKTRELLNLPEFRSRRYNPMDFVRKDTEFVGRDVNALLDALLTPPAGGHDASMHFYHSARAVIAGYVAWVKFMYAGKDQTLKKVSDLLSLSGDDRTQFMKEVRDCPRAAGGLPLMAVERMEQVGKDEGGSLFSTIANQMSFLQYPELAEHTAGSDFDPRELASGNMDIFVVVPEDMVEQARPWLRLWVTIPNAVSAVRRMERDLLIIVDEMPALGLLKPMMDSYTMSAGRGVHFWGFAQSISVLDESWGAGNRQVLMDLAEVVQILGFPRTDVDGAEKLSAAMGSASFENRSESHSGRSSTARVFAGASQLQVGDNVSVVKERIVMADEILTMGPERQFVVASPKDMPRDAFGLYHARYWNRSDAKGLADPNPLVLRKQEASDPGRFGMFAKPSRTVAEVGVEQVG
ncbi:MAG: type IV secretory system conjugative DNA transfer family protein [Defluviicoccus sp.]|nr:type IV secretory system conjugative DNA transfer family protein [Defluviicoccus sp.]MDE0279120.1 type IV secretory system conjugative DNA transfer family protein [Defluviicoccus sp.]